MKKIISDVVVDVYFWLHVEVVVNFGFHVDVAVDRRSICLVWL